MASDLAAVEATWVLAAARRDAARAGDARRRVALEAGARAAVAGLAARYPGNPIFRRFSPNARSPTVRAAAAPGDLTEGPCVQ
jgi:hypothetical protein